MVANIFSMVGSVHPCRTPEAMNALLASACLMGNFFRTLQESRNWCIAQGTDPVVASEYLASLYNGIIGADVKRVCSDPHGYEKLIAEQTPGGFNRRLIEMLDKEGIYKQYTKCLTQLHSELDAKK
jgi:pyrroline-5-carboxylate reductase